MNAWSIVRKRRSGICDVCVYGVCVCVCLLIGVTFAIFKNENKSYLRTYLQWYSIS